MKNSTILERNPKGKKMEHFHKTYDFLYTLNLSDGAIILYGIMRDRWELSLNNGWSDEEDKTYFYFSRKNIQEIRPRWGLRSISRFLKELLEANLLCAKYSSNGKDTKYYIMQIKPEILKAVMAKNTPGEFGNTPCEFGYTPGEFGNTPGEFGNTIRTIPISQTEQSDQKPDRHSTTTCAGEATVQERDSLLPTLLPKDDTTALNTNVRDIPKKAQSQNESSEVLDAKPNLFKQVQSQEPKLSEQALSDKQATQESLNHIQSLSAQNMGEELLAMSQDTKEPLSENLTTPKVAKDILDKNQEIKKEPSIKEILGIKETKSKESTALEPLTTNESKKEGFLSIKDLFKMAQKLDAKKQSKKLQETKTPKEESIFSGKSASISEQTNLSSQRTSGVAKNTLTSKEEFISEKNGASFKKPSDLFAQDEQTTKEPLSDIEIMLQEFKEHVNKNWDEIISGNIHAEDIFFSKSKNPLSDKFYFATKEQTNKTASPCVDKQNLVNSGANNSINNTKMNNEVNIFAQNEANLKAHSNKSPGEHFSVQTIKDTGKEAFVHPERSKKRLCANAQPIGLPDFIDAELFANFIQHRKEIKKPLTPHARDLIIKKLSDFNSRGLDANKALENSIINGWQGVFEPRSNKFNYQKNSDLSNAQEVGALGLPLSAMSAWQQANTRKIQGF